MRRWLLAASVAAVCVFAQTASAGVVMSATPVSPNPSPFGSCDNQGLAGNYPNAEVEPWIAVDPTNSNYAVAWQQDRWGDPNEGGAHALVSWSSVGSTLSWAPFTRCSGGTSANHGDYDRASDVWLSYGPDGRLYEAALPFDWFTGRNAVTASTSTDDGRTWSTPAVVASSDQKSFTHGFDKEAVTADPYHAGVAYIVFDQYSNQNPDSSSGNGQNANKGPAYISTTTDGGKTWSSAKPIYTQDNGTLANQLVVLKDGTLVDFFTNFIFSGKAGGWTTNLEYSSSTNGGNSWSKPVVVSDMQPVGTVDPNTGGYIRAADSLFDIAYDPSSGALYAVWQDSRFTNGAIDQVAFSKSVNGGPWTTPVPIAKTPATAADRQSFTPSIDVSGNGTVAVTYYDFRNWTTPGSTLPTDYWAITSANGGNTWGSEIRLTPASFNGELAPVASGGLMIGDYEGLAHAGKTFLAAFEVGNNASDPTDIDVAGFNP